MNRLFHRRRSLEKAVPQVRSESRVTLDQDVIVAWGKFTAALAGVEPKFMAPPTSPEGHIVIDATADFPAE